MLGMKKGMWLSQSDQWKSDDSEDSDFNLSGDEGKVERESSRKRKQLADKESERESKRQLRSRVAEPTTTDETPSNWGHLPQTVLENIFSHVVIDSKDFLVLNKLGSVCRHWYFATLRPKLRTHLKLMVRTKAGKTRAGFEKLKAGLESFDVDDLKYLHHLSFVNFENHLTKSFALLLECTFSLDHLEIFTSRLGNLTLWKKFITNNCSTLTSFTANGFTFSNQALNNILNIKSLTRIVLHDSGPVRSSINWSIASSLEHLDIYYSAQQAGLAGAEIELVKLKLPKLVFLQLANVVISERGVGRELERAQNGEIELEGFPKLKFLSLRRSFITVNNSIDALLYLLRKTECIETIDLQGCDRYDYNDLIVALGPLSNHQTLRTLDLTGIDARAGFCDFFRRDGLDVKIENLTVSTNKTKIQSDELFTHFIRSMISNNEYLKKLNISKTNIENPQLLTLLNSNKKLEVLNLTSCHGAPRGWRREVHSAEFPTLIRLCQKN